MKRDQTDVAFKVMLYICEKCGSSFSLPFLPKEEQGFLFPSSECGYLHLSLDGENRALYDSVQERMDRYSYPYLNFYGFEKEGFFHYVNELLWADLIDRDAGELISPSVGVPCCPHCRSLKLKQIGELQPNCQGENCFVIYNAALTHWKSLPSEEQNRQIIVKLKEYANSYQENIHQKSQKKTGGRE